MTAGSSRIRWLYLQALLCVLFSIYSPSTAAQKLPNEIRGYKVYEARVKLGKSIACDSHDRDKGDLVSMAEPKLDGVSVTGMTIEISAAICSLEQSGQIEFLTFRDFRVNGVAVEIGEYRNRLKFTKNTLVSLPKPVKVIIGIKSIVKSVYKELVESKDEWNVTGTVFVFGKYKKMGFSFKRVVPVKIDLAMKNPL